jgi:hypothetical protein
MPPKTAEKASGVEVTTAEDPNGKSATVSLDAAPKGNIVVEVVTPNRIATYPNTLEKAGNFALSFKLDDEGDYSVRLFSEETDEGGNVKRTPLGSKNFTV